MVVRCTNLVAIFTQKGLLRECNKNIFNQSKFLKLQRVQFSTNDFCRVRRDTSLYGRPTKSIVCGEESNKKYIAAVNHAKCRTSSNLYYSSEKIDNSIDKSELTHFGFKQVKENEKVNKVYNVFESVADTYAIMNDAMSAGIHRLWKNHFVEYLNVKPGMKILDMAGGTGDIAFKILDYFLSNSPNTGFGNNDIEIIITDINQAMLDVGKKRAQKRGIYQSFEWIQANAEELPFEDESFDLYNIAFGIRNTTHIEQVLDEAFRVLKIGGRLSCLEFSHVANPIISSLYDSYSFQIIPIMGTVLVQDWNSYQYLVESIRQFPNQQHFADLIYDAGFSNVRFDNLTFGVVAIHDGFKI